MIFKKLKSFVDKFGDFLKILFVKKLLIRQKIPFIFPKQHVTQASCYLGKMLPGQNVTRQNVTGQNVNKQIVTWQNRTRQNVAKPCTSLQLAVIPVDIISAIETFTQTFFSHNTILGSTIHQLKTFIFSFIYLLNIFFEKIQWQAIISI